MPPRTAKLTSTFLRRKKQSEQSVQSDYSEESDSASDSRGARLRKRSKDPSSDSDSSTDTSSFSSRSEASDSNSGEESEEIDKEANYGDLPENLEILKFHVFELKDRDPDTVFALSYDVALHVGLRSSSALFTRYEDLKRLWTTDEEREYLVSIDALSANVKRKNIGIVDVRQLIGVIGLEELSSSFDTFDIHSIHAGEGAGGRRKRILRKLKQQESTDYLQRDDLLKIMGSKLTPNQMNELETTSFDDEEALNAILNASNFNENFTDICLNEIRRKPAYLVELKRHERQRLNHSLDEFKVPKSLLTPTGDELSYISYAQYNAMVADKARLLEAPKNSQLMHRLSIKNYIEKVKTGIPKIKL